MTDEMLRVAGRGIDGNAKAIKTDNDGFMLTKPALNAIEEITIFDTLEIRDTNNHERSLNLSKYKSVTFVAYSRLDKDINILFRHDGNTIKVWDGSDFVELKTNLSTSARYFKVILNSVLPELNNNFVSLGIRVNCPIAPTTEYFTLKAYGELR